MEVTIKKALISVYHKNGLDKVVEHLHECGVELYSTGGTFNYINSLGVPCKSVESVSGYPSILGGRVKTLHPAVMGGILVRRALPEDIAECERYNIPQFDLVIVDLYPFQNAVEQHLPEQDIIEKIDIGGISLLRGAAKNYEYVSVICSSNQYASLVATLKAQQGATTLSQRRQWAATAFEHCAHYDVAIAGYFMQTEKSDRFQLSIPQKNGLRYGENPHQAATYYGNATELFIQLHGKEISYNNLADIDAILQLIGEFKDTCYAVVKHTNVCGFAIDNVPVNALQTALSSDPESAFGGIWATNAPVTEAEATAMNGLFFEVLLAPDYSPEALAILQSKKNRILLQTKPAKEQSRLAFKSLLNGVLVQEKDTADYQKWEEVGGRPCTDSEITDLTIANIIAKNLKSNAIAIVKNRQLIGKGCGQTSRIDALKQCIEKAKQFEWDVKGAVMASDGFFPFSDSIAMAHKEGITAVIQPGGSVRDEETIAYAKQHNMAMVLTGTRHFKH
ncbi:MAG: bifunctional phosphoribosylaminoimidazolecarboxamide formyltransferase/IMP cyclohydrolase PurH [Chitinophagia bacterium]|nr:bifunctional phosphoribosylaminoimidazolecarboxamide formyltransferase/IMP cyclohydrolase PurH [Chitinophagia bacterium]